MSRKLSISAALSVLMMVGFVVLGTDDFAEPIGPHGHAGVALVAPVQVLSGIR